MVETLIPAQVRAARAMIEWPQTRLAEAAGVGLSTVKAFETMGSGKEVLE
jgi:DNA-binding XRE family transcriptional regulator